MKTALTIFVSFFMALFVDIIFGMVFTFAYMSKYNISNRLDLSEDYGFGMLLLFGSIGLFVVIFIASIFITGNIIKNYRNKIY